MFETTADAVPRSGTSRRADFLPSAAAFEATIGGIGRTAGAEGERGATDRLLSLADLRMPGPAQVNPRAWEIRMIVEDRCHRLGIMLPNFAGYTTMSAYLFPTGAVELLVPVAVFNNLLYYIDDVYSTPGAHLSGAGNEHVVRRIRDGVDVFCHGATPPGDDPVFATCGWLRDTMLAVAPPGWFPRLAASLEHHLGAVLTPLQAVMVDGALDLGQVPDRARIRRRNVHRDGLHRVHRRFPPARRGRAAAGDRRPADLYRQYWWIDKLRDLHNQLDTGISPKTGYAHYTVRQAADDWLAHGLEGRSPKTIKKNQNVLKPLLKVIGARKLRDLSAADVRQALATMATGYSTAAVSMGHLALKRAIRHAEANDLISRNVAALADTPKGQQDRPSKSLTLDQAIAVITAAATLPVMELRPGLKDVRRPAELMHAYIVLSLLAGIRTEEAHALHWAHVNLDGDPAATPPVPPHVAVWRSVRAHGETKTQRSRRTLRLPQAAVQALRAWSDNQASEQTAAGDDWQDTGLVFTSHHGAALDAANVRKMFKRVCTEAGIGDGWTPRELRTSFVSLMSHHGVSIEEIARLVGHASTRTTEIVYRRELRPVITTGTEIMDQLFTAT